MREKGRIRQLVLAVLAALACLALICGATMAWFTYRYRLSSIGRIHPLTTISILAPGDTVIQSIDLSYDKSEVTDGQVSLKRPFVIRSGAENFDLCIAHTTNISGLTIELYEATADGEENSAYIAGITEKGTPYYWNKKNGTNLFNREGYLNLEGEVGSHLVAKQDHDAHRETFRLTEDLIYDNVQKYAEPLYWVMKGATGVPRTGDDENYYTNYILEISWNETDKETDILYVIAQTSDAQAGETGN